MKVLNYVISIMLEAENKSGGASHLQFYRITKHGIT
jgi:hypothetical protein